jgi:BlaI family penicillinase repressor
MEVKAPLSELEREVMNIIWRRGNRTAIEVQKDLAAERPLRDSTIRTVLMRLEEKGYVQHEVNGRTFVYSCLQPAGSVAARAVKQILDRFCQGSLESLLIGMVEDELVDADELQEIANRLSRERRDAVIAREGRKKRR